MKTKLNRILNTNVDPLFFAVPCVLLIAAMGQATLYARQINKSHEAMQDMMHNPFPNQLWMNPHRAAVLAPYLAQPISCAAK